MGELLGPDGLPVRSGSEELRDLLAADPGRFRTGQLPNRREKRAIKNSIRAYRVRAARARDKAASEAAAPGPRRGIVAHRQRKGIGTPPESIETALARAVGYSDANQNGRVLLP